MIAPPTWRPPPPRIWDICPYFSDYISEVEANLSLDPGTFAEYLKNPVPALLDILNDFGEPGYTDEQKLFAAKEYAGG